MARIAIPIGLVKNATATPRAVVTPAAIPATRFQAPTAKVTRPHAAAKAPIIVAITCTVVWCSVIQSLIPFKASAKPFRTSTMTPPVQLARGCRKLSHSHCPSGFNASMIELSTSIAPDKVSRNAGINSWMVNPASGSRTFL